MTYFARQPFPVSVRPVGDGAEAAFRNPEAGAAPSARAPYAMMKVITRAKTA
jgi:hypothetical protein